MTRLLIAVLTAVIAAVLIFLKPEFNQLVIRWLGRLSPSPSSCLLSNETLFTAAQLAEYDGRDDGKGVYLSFLGRVYDVSRGRKHYGPGGTYSVFAGRDASRAFVTGDFDVGHIQDDVTDLEIAAFSGIREWEQFYQRDYRPVGRLIGSYYDSIGCPTLKLDKVRTLYDELDRQTDEKLREDDKYPPCNSEWSQETKVTRFWCTKMSGGVSRSWTGVPRNLFDPKSKSSRCACIRSREERDNSHPSIEYADDEVEPLVEAYPGCDPHSSQCSVPDSQ